MAGLKVPTILRQSSHNSHYNQLIDHKNKQNSSENSTDIPHVTPLGEHLCINSNIVGSKENKTPVTSVKKVSNVGENKENVGPYVGKFDDKMKNPDGKLQNFKKERSIKSSSLQLCIQINEPDSSFGLMNKACEADDEMESAKSVNIWYFSDNEAAPVSSWSTLPNRALLCRALPIDVGKCTCIIHKEAAPQGLGDGSLYSLYTSEGHGRQNRQLAVAYHRRRNGRSIFIIAQNTKGVLSPSDESFIGVVTANLMGSKYYIWDQGRTPRRRVKEAKLLQAIVEFTPTISTWTGNHRSIRAWIPKKQQIQQQSTQLKNLTHQVHNVKGLPSVWEGKMDQDQDQVQLLLSRIPHYNKISKQYELDFRDKVRAGVKIQSSVKNFQLTMEGDGRQTILQLGRLGKSKYLFDYRHPLTAYQAFCMCLASIDPKLCCTV